MNTVGRQQYGGNGLIMAAAGRWRWCIPTDKLIIAWLSDIIEFNGVIGYLSGKPDKVPHNENHNKAEQENVRP